MHLGLHFLSNATNHVKLQDVSIGHGLLKEVIDEEGMGRWWESRKVLVVERRRTKSETWRETRLGTQHWQIIPRYAFHCEEIL
ncbi:hypothetical protein E2C01_033605 [Portunus trituberculatus]|uniref:Uncharacterized protein n=1 Tax=Portunus trituberculatus TaxID=210409 RepID=A0A5B7F0K3_PORTR|nr:hypothetical protein [Portunus trituberculatus]